MSPTFSIIIPTFNRAVHLPAAIRSVLAQTSSDWELIIIDDGSEDNTKEVTAIFTEDPRIHYNYQENRELNGARNTGVRLARGTYCCFLDDDDRYEENHLEVLTKAIAQTSAKHGIYRTNMRISSKGKSSTSSPFNNDRDALVQLWKSPRNLLSLAIRRELLVRHQFDENDLLIDDFIWLNTALTRTTLFQADPITTIYVQHNANRTKLYHSVLLLPKITSSLKRAYSIPEVQSRVSKSMLHARIHHQHMHLARQLGRQRSTLKAIRIWRKGLVYTRLPSIVETLTTLAHILTR